MLPIDIIKADLIGKRPSKRQEHYTKLWEDIEDDTGRDDLNTLFEFQKKRELYFSSKKTGTTAYALTTQVLHESEWRPKTLEKRQKALLAAFRKSWELKG